MCAALLQLRLAPPKRPHGRRNLEGAPCVSRCLASSAGNLVSYSLITTVRSSRFWSTLHQPSRRQTFAPQKKPSSVRTRLSVRCRRFRSEKECKTLTHLYTDCPPGGSCDQWADLGNPSGVLSSTIEHFLHMSVPPLSVRV